MATPQSTPGSSPKADLGSKEGNSPNESSPLEGGGSLTKSILMISTPETTPRTDSSKDSNASESGSRSKTARTAMSPSDSTQGNTPKTGEISSQGSDRFEFIKEMSTTDSTQAGSLGEVEEEGILEEQSSLSDGQSINDNLEDILNEFEIFDSEKRAEIRNNLTARGQTEALEKVAHVAQSTLRRLQKAVKEKDELIISLQEAVRSACKAALEQQERDQKDLQLIHEMFLPHVDRTIEAVKYSLQEIILQQPESGKGLAGQVAKLFDQYLHELLSQHEQENEAVQKDLAMWRTRCQELETLVGHDKQLRHSHLREKLTDSVLDWERAKQQLDVSETLVATLKEQLNDKDEQLQVYRESVESLANLLEEEKMRQMELTTDYDQVMTHTRETVGKVSLVNHQLHQLRQHTQKHQLLGHAIDFEVKHAKGKINHQNGLIHKLTVELAALRKKSLKSATVLCKECGSPVETQKQVQLLQDCILALVAQILELKRELEMEGQKKNDPNSQFLLDHVQPNTSSDHLSTKDSPRTLVKHSLKFVTNETIKKLEGFRKITRKAEVLQKKLDACKQAMGNSDIELNKSGAKVEKLRYELRKANGMMKDLEAKLQKKVDNIKKKPTDCIRIKGLLENIEKIEVENSILKHEVMVQKSSQISRLERELQKVQILNAAVHGGQEFKISAGHDSRKTDEKAWDKVKTDLESTIISKDSHILELRFELDQATWKLAQVEKRFNILFGALECRKFDFDEPVTDSLLESIFSSEDLNPPSLNLLREKLLARRGYSRSGSREKELEALVEAIMEVVEKLSNENETLKTSCQDTVKQMEKNKELRKTIDHLQDQIVKAGQLPAGERPNSTQTAVIAGLRGRLSDLTTANSGLIRALRETEDQCSSLKQMVHEQGQEEGHVSSGKDERKSQKGRRLSFSEDEQREKEKSLTSQTAKIRELERQVVLDRQVIIDLKQKLERQENELDLIHGKLSIKMLSEEGCENIQQRKDDLWASSILRVRHKANSQQTPEDFFDKEYLAEYDYEMMQAENQKLRKYVTTLHNPELLGEIRDVKLQYDRLSRVCDRYEELLGIYSRQIGIPFSTLRPSTDFVSSRSTGSQELGETNIWHE